MAAIARLTTRDGERIFAEPLEGLDPEDRAAIVNVIGSTLHVTVPPHAAHVFDTGSGRRVSG